MTALATAAITIAVLMVVTWLISLAKKNASIVDIVWGLGFVLVAWAVRLRVDTGLPARQNLLVALTTIWGLRLAGYLLWRNHGNGEDYRYRAMRKHWGARFPLVSLLTVFGLQGVLMFIVSLGVQLGQTRNTPELGWLAYVGVAVWLLGIFFEWVGDAQLALPLAEELAGLLDQGATVAARQALERLQVPLGGGATRLPMARLIPPGQLRDLEELVEPFCG